MDHPPLKTDKKTLREFGLVFAGGLIIFFGLLIPWMFDKPWVWQELEHAGPGSAPRPSPLPA